MPPRKRARSAVLLAEIARFAGTDSDRTTDRLLTVLRVHFSGLEIFLFEARGRHITPIAPDVDVATLAAEKDVNTCLSDRKPVYAKSTSKPTVLIPVLVNNAASILVVARHSKRARPDIDELAMLVQAYGDVLSLVQVSERDTLTGLFNRRLLDQRLPDLMARLRSPRRRATDPLSAHLAIMDVDRFKKINDLFGHLYGDEVLLLLSTLMRQSFRSSDLLVRYGGEEFVVILTDTTLAHAEHVLERFRKKVEEYWFPHVGRATLSIGATRIADQVLPSTVIDQADQALYYAKRTGRNRVCIYEKLVNSGLIGPHGLSAERLTPFKEKRKLPTRRKVAATARNRRKRKRAG